MGGGGGDMCGDRWGDRGAGGGDRGTIEGDRWAYSGDKQGDSWGGGNR